MNRNSQARFSVGSDYRVDTFGLLGFSVAIALALLMVYPLVTTYVSEFWSADGLDLSAFERVLRDGDFHSAVLNTGLLLAISGAIALGVAAFLAWLNERTDARFGMFSDLLPIVPLFVPLIAQAIGWVLLAQPRAGFINGALRGILDVVGINLTEGPLNIGTWPGLVFTYAIALVPFAYLMIASALRNMDTSFEEASRMSGAGRFRTLVSISLPAVRPAIFSAVLLMTMIGVSFFSIPRTIGLLARVETVSVYLVRLTQTYPSRIDEAIAVSMFLLVVLGAIWTMYSRVSRQNKYSTLGGKSGSAAAIKLGRWRWVARALMLGYLSVVSVLPLAALVIVALQPFWQSTIDLSSLSLDQFREFFRESKSIAGLFNSVRLGVIGATLVVAIAAIVAIYAREKRGLQARALEGITKAPGAISNLVIGLAILVALAGPPFGLGGTLVILLLGYMVCFMPQGSIAAEVARGQVHHDLTEASLMAGATRLRTVRLILLPLMRPGLAAGWALVFVIIVGDLTISAILAGIGNPVVGSLFLGIWETGGFDELAVLGTLVCLTTTITVAIVVGATRRRRGRRRSPRPADGGMASIE